MYAWGETATVFAVGDLRPVHAFSERASTNQGRLGGGVAQATTAISRRRAVARRLVARWGERERPADRQAPASSMEAGATPSGPITGCPAQCAQGSATTPVAKFAPRCLFSQSQGRGASQISANPPTIPISRLSYINSTKPRENY